MGSSLHLFVGTVASNFVLNCFCRVGAITIHLLSVDDHSPKSTLLVLQKLRIWTWVPIPKASCTICKAFENLPLCQVVPVLNDVKNLQGPLAWQCFSERPGKGQFFNVSFYDRSGTTTQYGSKRTRKVRILGRVRLDNFTLEVFSGQICVLIESCT